MADNITLDAGSGGATVATDDDGTAHHQYVKLEWGADNTQTKVSTGAAAVPIQDGGNTITVDGTVTANLSATDNAVLDTIETNTDFGTVTGGGTETGALRVTLANNSTGVVSVDDNGGALTVDNGGTFAVQVDGDALTALQLIDDAVHADDAAFTLGTSKGVMIMGFAGTQSVNANDAAALACDTDGALHIADGGNSITVDGTITANAGTNLNTSALALESGGNLATLAGAVSGSEMQVDVVAALPAGTNAIGKLAANSGVDIGDVDVTSVPRASSHYRNIDANAESEIKSSAGTLFWIHAINLTAAIAYLHLYDAAAASVTPGSTTPTFTFPIPTQGDTNGAGFNLAFNGGGHAFANGITLVVTTTTDGSAGDPGTNGVFVNAGYA